MLWNTEDRCPVLSVMQLFRFDLDIPTDFIAFVRRPFTVLKKFKLPIFF